jgi:tRNA modification GTPase
MHGRIDMTQAESVADLIAAESKAEARVAITQLKGGITQEIQALRDQLIHFASMLELELDFGEEDVEFADRVQLRKLLDKADQRIQTLIDSFKLGNAIKYGITTVIAGRPNAGKSTLLNAMLQEDRAIVSDIPGTTRDTIEEVLHVEGIPFRLVDTAGIREAKDQIEAIGVQRTHDKIRQSSVLLYVFDVTEMRPAEVEADIYRLMHADLEVILVPNKMDLNPYTLPEDYIMPGISREDIVPTSAKNNMNIIYLKERLLQTINKDHTLLSQNILTNSRHVDCLQKVKEHLSRAKAQVVSNSGHELIAMDIRQALHYLGEISGEVSTEDLLESIFSRFCIGK